MQLTHPVSGLEMITPPLPLAPPNRFQNQYRVHVPRVVTVWISKRCAPLDRGSNNPSREFKVEPSKKKVVGLPVLSLGVGGGASVICHWTGWTCCLHGWGLLQLKPGSPGAGVKGHHELAPWKLSCSRHVLYLLCTWRTHCFLIEFFFFSN